MRRAGLIAASLGAVLGCAGWLLAQPESVQAGGAAPWVQVDFEDPIPTGPVEVKGKDKEECITSCSLAKHHIDPLTAADFEEALAGYAAAGAEEASAPFEKLLFYGPDTRRFMQSFGVDILPPAHQRALERELARDHALVSLRLVDDSGVVRVAYGPERVPIGKKQHLTPVGDDLQAMEFNGTVMRTGVNYLWSRY